MKIFNYDSLCSIDKFPEHEKYKDQTLKLINSDPSGKNLKKGNTMDIFSDWSTDNYSTKLYWRNIGEPIYQYVKNVTTEMGYRNASLANFWYQQYNKGGKHGWHVHEYCMFTSVYYLEFPEGSPRTEFKNTMTNEVFVPDVEEGDIMIFPSFIAHRSPINDTDNRKTILSWNINVQVDTE